MKAHSFVLAAALLSACPVLYGNAAGIETPRLSNAASPQQSKKISGVVKDTSGEPVIGANVIVKGTTVGTMTDIDGQFNLEVPSDAILQISYIGYLAQEMPVRNQTAFNIRLVEDSQALDEVVVVGFGTQKKVNLTGSVGTVDSLSLIHI